MDVAKFLISECENVQNVYGVFSVDSLQSTVYKCRNYLLNRLRIQIFDSRSSLKDSVGNNG